MKALIQRVSHASVALDHEIGQIGRGLVVFIGVASGDGENDAEYLVSKILNLRIFSDEKGKFNLSVVQTVGQILFVSQFTLLADSRHGRRPSFTDAASPSEASRLFDYLVKRAKQSGLEIATGRFGEHMVVEIHNDGPVTIILDSRDR
jgi:D-tyrosyl-tRNA(Tyr) deacylase